MGVPCFNSPQYPHSSQSARNPAWLHQVARTRRAAIEALVAAAFAVPLIELRAASRRRAPIAFARQSAMYLAHVVLGLTYSEIGRAFGRDRTTAAHACQIVEERRDDPRIDALLSRLEGACLSLVERSLKIGEGRL